jgi:hypothetical protein
LARRGSGTRDERHTRQSEKARGGKKGPLRLQPPTGEEISSTLLCANREWRNPAALSRFEPVVCSPRRTELVFLVANELIEITQVITASKGGGVSESKRMIGFSHIVSINSGPTSVITMTTGEKINVKETYAELKAKFGVRNA